MNRLDKELIARNLVSSRTKAQELIEKGYVLVNGKQLNKTSFQVAETDKIEIKENEVLKYVSRGGLKLEKAIKVFNYSVKGKTIMDIGSSTGGFTDCCLQNGAKKMICIDVGSNVMDATLRKDNRIELYENTNIKDADSSLFNGIDLIVVDVSFISLERIIERVSGENIKVDIICLIKPQFECGKEIAKKYNGVILNKTVHKDILKNVISKFAKNGFNLLGLDVSPIKGGDGNIEYLAYFTNKSDKSYAVNIEKTINNAFK